MATIWPYKREECTEIPTLVFNPQTKVDFDGENKAILTEQDPNLTEFSLSVPLLKKVSNYFGKNSKDVKIDYCLVVDKQGNAFTDDAQNELARLLDHNAKEH